MKFTLLPLGLIISVILVFKTDVLSKQDDFQGEAIYMYKSSLELGSFGANMSEAQKNQIKERLKNRLEKTFTLVFNREESFYKENERLDAVSGATDSWGNNFAAGDQYKNVKTNTQIQEQEFYGKRFLVKDELQPIKWTMASETKKIGNYMCFKAVALIPTNDLTWYSFSWDKLRPASNEQTQNSDSVEEEMALTKVEAWYTPQIPVSHGPSEFWGLPGLILEINSGNITMLCSKLTLNPQEKLTIKIPQKGEQVTKKEYQDIILTKMMEFRDNRIGRR
ncbi:GLPGLI family protein [Aegicerativicinus sediminis]|uniref:GLPGLI family protein n=1 Tax=Aegicerativicinus sediminis TaxID=2893202 RepID=UPI001E449D29|nr:GLPGLI family protein [Aegicerativicinus sediminis]